MGKRQSKTESYKEMAYLSLKMKSSWVALQMTSSYMLKSASLLTKALNHLLLIENLSQVDQTERHTHSESNTNQAA